MGYRIVVVILCLFLLFIPQVSFTNEDVKIIKTRNIGKSPIEYFFVLDVNDELKAFLNKMSQEDSLRYILFHAYIFNKDYDKLYEIINDVRDKSLKENLLYELFLFVEKDNADFSRFKKIFNELIKKEGFDKIRFLLALRENRREENYNIEYLNALNQAILLMEKEDFPHASEVIKNYSYKLPRTYLYVLLNAKRYKEALEFLSSLQLEEKSFYEALIYYYTGDCQKVIEKLSDNKTFFKGNLLLLDCGKGEEKAIDRDVKKAFNDEVLNDPFLFFLKLEQGKLTKEREVIQPYKTFYFSFQLKNVLNYLSLYKDEIEKFVRDIEKSNKDLKSILSKYEKMWDELEKRGMETKVLREKIVNIQEKMTGIRELSFSSNIDVKKTITFLDEQIAKAKAQIKMAVNEYEERVKKEEQKLKWEREIRSLLQEIYSKNSFTTENYLKIYPTLKNYYEIAKKEHLSVEEDVAFAKIYLLWYYLQGTELNDRETLINNLIGEIQNYLASYKDREKEALLLLAESYENLGLREKALKVYEDYLVLESLPDARTYMKIGEILFDMGQYEKAIDFFEKTAKKSQSYRNAAYYKIGWSYYLMGDLSKVADLFLSYNYQDESDKALILFDEMMELLSRTFYKLGVEKISEFLQKYPDFMIPEKLFKGVGDLYLFLAEYEKALVAYDKGLKEYYLYKFSPELLTARIELFSLLGQTENAYAEKHRFINLYNSDSEYFKKFRTFPKEYREFLYSLGVYHNLRYENNRDQKDFDLSFELYKRFLKEFPEDQLTGEVFYLIAQLYEDKKNYQDAYTSYQRAWQKGFKVEESLYKALYTKYKLWQEGKINSDELILELQKYVETYPAYEKTLSAVIVLSDMLIKEHREKELTMLLDNITTIYEGERLTKVLDFCEANFTHFEDKKSLAIFFQRGFEKLKDKRYLELKHYAIFSDAKKKEEENDLIQAKQLYSKIIDDRDVTAFKEYALFNLALIFEKEGNIKEAISAMERIKNKPELVDKAKEFIFIYGKKEKLYDHAAEAALELAKLNEKNRNAFYLESAVLYLKTKNFTKAEEISKQLEGVTKTEKEEILYFLINGVIAAEKGNFDGAFDSFSRVVKKEFSRELDDEFINSFHKTLKNTIFLKPEDEARQALEDYIEFLTKRYKQTGAPEYLFSIAEALSDFSLFFLQKEEALSKAVDFYKRALKISTVGNKSELIVKIVEKLKQLQPELYSKELEIPLLNVHFLEDIKYEELFE